MKARFWIKLYIEILDDPKMGRLANHLWRRAVELFLFAGREGNDGALPPVEEMAWTLRLPEGKLLEDLHGLAEVGVVHAVRSAAVIPPADQPGGAMPKPQPGSWFVTHFKERQSAVPVEERVRRYRMRNDHLSRSQAAAQGQNVTDRYQDGNEAEGVVSTSTLIFESDSSLEDKEQVQAEENLRALPSSPAEAVLHPDVGVFTAVTGGRIPGLAQYRAVIETVRLLRGREKLEDQALVRYLAPYWQAWSGRSRLDGRPYDPGNISWLTEWALNGTVPAVGKDTVQDKAEVIKQVAGRKSGRSG
jgi:hypothetical protein